MKSLRFWESWKCSMASSKKLRFQGLFANLSNGNGSKAGTLSNYFCWGRFGFRIFETSPSREHFGSTHQWHKFEIGLPVTEGQGLSGLRELWLPLDVSLAGGFCCHKDFSCLKKNKEILKTLGMKLGQMARNDMHFFMGSSHRWCQVSPARSRLWPALPPSAMPRGMVVTQLRVLLQRREHLAATVWALSEVPKVGLVGGIGESWSLTQAGLKSWSVIFSLQKHDN